MFNAGQIPRQQVVLGPGIPKHLAVAVAVPAPAAAPVLADLPAAPPAAPVVAHVPAAPPAALVLARVPAAPRAAQQPAVPASQSVRGFPS